MTTSFKPRSIASKQMRGAVSRACIGAYGPARCYQVFAVLKVAYSFRLMAVNEVGSIVNSAQTAGVQFIGGAESSRINR